MHHMLDHGSGSVLKKNSVKIFAQVVMLESGTK